MDWTGLIRAAAARLAEAGVESPRVDAELIAAHTSGRTRTALLIADAPDGETAGRFEDLVSRRAKREPLQHLTGAAAFRNVELAVGPGVFVPRPETELVAGWAVEHAPRGGRVVEACSGSGAIAAALADERPDLSVWAVEIDADAFEWTERNLAGTGVSAVRADATDAATLAELDGTVDLVVSNPPYVPMDIEVAPEVHWDPTRAVFAEDNGLSVIEGLIERSRAWLRPGGLLGFEHDQTHDADVRALLEVGGFAGAATEDDYAGRPRFTTAGKQLPHDQTPRLSYGRRNASGGLCRVRGRMRTGRRHL